MATGREMLVRQLIGLLGLDTLVANNVVEAAEKILEFDARLKRIESKIDILLGNGEAIDVRKTQSPKAAHANGAGPVIDAGT